MTVCPAPTGRHDPFVAACRNEGVGTRVIAMVNALWLAERLELPFRFHWPKVGSDFPERSVPPARAVFRPDFLETSHRSRVEVLAASPCPEEVLARATILDMLQDPTRRGLVIHHAGGALRLDETRASPSELRAAWERIGWSPWLRNLESRARASMPPRGVAVHVRRGDIVHGTPRRLHWPDKFRPRAWMRRVIEDLCTQGETVVVFSDTPSTVDALCAGLPVLRADQMRPAGTSGFGAAFFDVCALAAARRIVGSRSGFTTLASLIGGTLVELVEQLIPPDLQVPLVTRDLGARPDRYAPLERVHELIWLCMQRPEWLAPGQAKAFLEEARRLDPDNDLPKVLLAQFHLRGGDMAAAERLLAEAAEQSHAAQGRVSAWLYPERRGIWSLPGVLSSVPSADRERLPYLNAYATELAGAQEPDRVAWTARALQAAPGSDLLLSRHVLALADAGDAPAALARVEERLHRADAPVVLWTLRACLRRRTRTRSTTASSIPPEPSTHPAAVRALISRLRPVPIRQDLVRIGPAHDGGYLLPDDLQGIVALISPGTGLEARFDHAMAERGLPVFMADGSVPGPPLPHERFHFERKFLGLRDDSRTLRLETLVRKAPPDGDLILQMDIEGGEYPVLLDASSETLGRFRVMLIEFHGCGRLLEPESSDLLFATLERLLQTHVVVHVHPNNAGRSTTAWDIPVPEILEFTFHRRDRVAIDPDRVLYFPHPLDGDNVPSRTPLPLPAIWQPDRSNGAVQKPDGQVIDR